MKKLTAKGSVSRGNQQLVVTAVIGKTLGYLIPLVALYCLGALVGWVYKGFVRVPK